MKRKNIYTMASIEALHSHIEDIRPYLERNDKVLVRHVFERALKEMYKLGRKDERGSLPLPDNNKER